MEHLQSWLPLIAAAAGYAALWGRMSEKLSRIEETLRRLELKEDERGRTDKALEGRVAKLEQAFADGMRVILATEDSVEKHSQDIAWLKGKRPSDPNQIKVTK